MSNIVYLGEIVTGDKINTVTIVVRDRSNLVTGLKDFTGYASVSFVGKTATGAPVALTAVFSGSANDGQVIIADATNGITLGSKERVRVIGQAKYVNGGNTGWSNRVSFDVTQAADWTG